MILFQYVEHLSILLRRWSKSKATAKRWIGGVLVRSFMNSYMAYLLFILRIEANFSIKSSITNPI